MSQALEDTPPQPAEPRRWWNLGNVLAMTGFVVLLVFLMPPAFEQIQSRGPKPCRRHLRQIGLALHNYHDTFGVFPPAVTLGSNGKPWHSWRVLILPFLEDERSKKLYARYRFDEPWNGPSNRLLLGERPEVFECHLAKGLISPRHTSYLAVVGPETVWPGSESVGLRDVNDGTSNVILVVEVRDAGVPWMSPDDLTMTEAAHPPNNKPGRHPSSFHQGGGTVLMCDGAGKFISQDLDSDTWRGLLTRDGGENLKDF